MRICVAGTGRVGLVIGTVFAELGNEVICVDHHREKIAALQAGRIPIYEPGLEEMVARNAADGRLSFITDLSAAVRSSMIVFITVGTRPKGDGRADLTGLQDVARTIGDAMERYTLIVNKSTVPVGTSEFLANVIKGHQRHPAPFDVIVNPEFVREGPAIDGALRPERIVIGAPTQQVALPLLELYAPLERPMIVTDVRSAEMIQHASNAFLATKISFINAFANVCELAGADVMHVAKGMGLDSRIGSAYLAPGLGYADFTLPTTADFGYDSALLREVAHVNEERATYFAEKIGKTLSTLRDARVAVLGLACKPHTDDMRGAKSIEVVSRLVDMGLTVQVYDPAAMENARNILPASVLYRRSPYEAATGADAVALVTEWDEFRRLNLERLRRVIRHPIVFDGRNIWDPQQMRRLGFEYHSVGRCPVLPA